tara:strand:- start:51 stop:515 length:465 start_codon:yes stop_codon:yes gene_type:complete
MTKWKRLRRLKEKRKAEAEALKPKGEAEEMKPSKPEKISDNVKHSQVTQKLETSKSNPILSQIPRYVYLVAIFALLSGVFFPLITTGADAAYNFVIGGTAILFLGLAGSILLFKGATSDGSRIILLIIGFVLVAISTALIFLVQEWWKIDFVRS